MSDWYAPNQQAVRGDQSGPGEEGEGGSERIDPEPVQQPVADSNAITKDELLARAQELGVSPANAGMTKDELQAGIDAKLKEEEAPA
jgi:hypothetical protein